MALVPEIRKSVRESTPVLAIVGATDLAVERVRAALADVTQVQAEVEARVTKVQQAVEKAVTGFDPKQLQVKLAGALDPKAVQAAAQQVPALAVARALEVAGRAEAGYEELAERGKVLLERVRTQKATQDLVHQGKVTVSRTKAAVTTARKAVDDTAAAARGAVKIGRQESAETVQATEEAVATATTRTRTATKKATTTARSGAAKTRSAAKGASTSARKSTSAAAKAAESAADKVGE
jgi:hypothetical protein